jgi:hypothetical protein
MAVNRGKDFEAAIRQALEFDGASVDRLSDPTAGYAGIHNICDFSAYKFPYQYYLECKSVNGNTLNFASGISQGQWEGLLEKAKIPGVLAGFFVWFILYDTTVFITAHAMEALRSAGKKSLAYKTLLEDDETLDYFLVPGRKKRVLFEYESEELWSRLTTTCNDLWKGAVYNGRKNFK